MWLLYALGAQIGWVTSNFLDKILLEKYMDEVKTPVLILYSSLFSIVVCPILFLLDTHIFSLGLIATLKVIASGVCSITWVYFYLRALEDDDASLVIPFFQFIPVFGMLFGAVFLGEYLSIQTILAILVVIAGGIVLSYDATFEKKTFKWNLIALMLTACFFVALSEMFFKWGGEKTSYFASQFWVHVGILSVGILFAFTQKKYWRAFVHSVLRKGKKVYGINMVNEGVNAFSNMLFGFALLSGLLAVVQASNAFQPILILVGSLFLSRFFPHILQENFEKKVLIQKCIGIGIVVVGSLFLYV